MQTEKSMVIFTHEIGCGGIGDMIRGMLTYYAFCVENNIQFNIDLTENEFINKCFDYDAVEYDKINCVHHRTTHGIFDKNYSPDNYAMLCKLMDDILTKPNTYIIKSNVVGFFDVGLIRSIKDKFFTEILKPSQKVIQNLAHIYNKYDISEKSYISIHVRCGDFNMGNKISSDDRICTEKFNFDCFNAFIKRTVDKIPDGFNKKLVLHSDSQKLKDFAKQYDQYITLDVNIKHTAENFGVFDEQSFVDTVSEFYFISQAHAIIMYNAYTGFSHIASIVNSAPLYTNVQPYANATSLCFAYLNDNNISHVN